MLVYSAADWIIQRLSRIFLPLKGDKSVGRTLTWLHLSDLHARKKTGWDSKSILKSLLADLKVMQEQHGLVPQLIFFTGDLTWEGTPEQFDEAHAFLESVRESVSPVIPRANVFIVPGNHDINRATCTEEQVTWLESVSKGQEPSLKIAEMLNENGKRCSDYMANLRGYSEFLKKNGYEHLSTRPDHLISANLRPFDGKTLGVVTLNSVWSSCTDVEHGQLLFGGDWQTEVLQEQVERADFRIALAHHPIDWCAEEENVVFYRDRGRRLFQVFLHGHNHMADAEARMAPPFNIAVISAGACYCRPDKTMGYNVVRLDLENLTPHVWMRRYDPSGHGWIPDVKAGRSKNDGELVLPPLKGTIELERGITTPGPIQPTEGVSKADLKEAQSLTKSVTELCLTVRRLMAVLEFEQAFVAARKLEDILRTHDAHLAPNQARESYYLLATIAVSEAKINRSPGQPIDVAKAQGLLEKAKEFGDE